MGRPSAVYFDAKDYELLTMVNRFIERDQRVPDEQENSFFHSFLHPHGIKELTMSQEIRVAYSVINLLDKLEAGQMQERIGALAALRKEVLSTSSGSFRYNTGRVLIQIMKGLVRAHGNPKEQLRLAHDFRKAATGKRRIIRQMLRRYYLLEMPEAWNQIVFDNHVHDANTKGRKSPTQLIMDAWIKGLRKLDVVYYNFVEPAAAAELLQAADVMDIRVRVGVEFQARFRDRFVQFIWQPRGFADWREMLDFFREKPTQHLMRMGREASLYHHAYVMQLLEEYNERLRFEMEREYGIELTAIPEKEILAYVGIGQMSRTHLAELIYKRIRESCAEGMDALRVRYAESVAIEKKSIEDALKRINALRPEGIIKQWLGKAKNPAVPLPSDPAEQDKIPEIMRLLPMTLIDWLTSIRTPCHITLNLSGLTAEDVLEILYECDGMVSHLELYNLKDYEDGKIEEIKAISELQTAINEGSAVALKRLIRGMIKKINCGEDSDVERCRLFTGILRNIPRLQSFYAQRPLATRVGSDSTSRSSRVHGMGFAFVETLPPRARKLLKEEGALRKPIPLTQAVYAQVTYYTRLHPTLGKRLTRLIRKLPGLKHFNKLKKETWEVDPKTARYSSTHSNVSTLGGFQRDPIMPFSLHRPPPQRKDRMSPAYMNTTLSNVLKVALGFLLTVCTFMYTQSWWVLAWFGPFIWFGITGFRNIVQATLGGAGFWRTPMLRWKDYVSWSRLCDSLMYTGISVPLLELGVRNLLLQDTLGITALNNPLVFYAAMSLINGLYITSHNIYRGLPPEAAVGNLFRSVLAIPVSMVYNFAAIQAFVFLGLPVFYIGEGAAVLSKMASDTVAALIEGFADKVEYIRIRHRDYVDKLSQLLDCFARMEVLLPEEDVLELLRRPKEFMTTVGREAKELEKGIIVNALDLMYFWMYQPRARSTLSQLIAGMTQEERAILAHSQLVLTRVQEVSQMLVDGLVGFNFARALAFYLERHQEYLRDMERLTGVPLPPGDTGGNFF